MKQASRMQRQVDEAKELLASKTVEASSGGGVVKVVARCDGTLVSVKIDPQAVNPADVPLIEDLFLSAANSALTQARDFSTAELQKATQGFSIPGLM